MLSKNGNLRQKNAAFRIRSITKEKKPKTKGGQLWHFLPGIISGATKEDFFVLFLKIKKEDGKFTYAAIDQRVVACEIGCTIQQNF